MSDPKLEEIAEAVAGKRCEYRGPGIVGPCAEFHEVCAATQRTNTLAILAALREAADAARREEREALLGIVWEVQDIWNPNRQHSSLFAHEVMRRLDALPPREAEGIIPAWL